MQMTNEGSGHIHLWLNKGVEIRFMYVNTKFGFINLANKIWTQISDFVHTRVSSHETTHSFMHVASTPALWKLCGIIFGSVKENELSKFTL